MGNRISSEMAEAVKEGLALEAALIYQLTVNHYPPIPEAFIETAKEAIRLANEHDSEEWSEIMVSCPEGGLVNGKTEQNLGFWIEVMHLWEFLDARE